jgi:hypothetical protein
MYCGIFNDKKFGSSEEPPLLACLYPTSQEQLTNPAVLKRIIKIGDKGKRF